MRLLIVIIALAVGITDDGSKKGRKGNENYRKQQHAEASALYKEGLDASQDSKPRILAGLWNNLGSSLFRTGDFQQARDAFSNALGFAESEAEISHFAYNTGNSIYSEAKNANSQQPPPSISGAPPSSAPAGGGGGQALQEALNYYRQALLADPTNEDARFNYEFVKRQLQEQEQNQDQENQEQQENQDQQNQEQNQDQENQDQQNQDQQNQDQQNQDQQQENQQEQQQPQEQQQQPQNDPTKLSREEAERILQALQNEEEELLRQVMKPQTRPKKVEKDW